MDASPVDSSVPRVLAAHHTEFHCILISRVGCSAVLPQFNVFIVLQQTLSPTGLQSCAHVVSQNLQSCTPDGRSSCSRSSNAFVASINRHQATLLHLIITMLKPAASSVVDSYICLPVNWYPPPTTSLNQLTQIQQHPSIIPLKARLVVVQVRIVYLVRFWGSTLASLLLFLYCCCDIATCVRQEFFVGLFHAQHVVLGFRVLCNMGPFCSYVTFILYSRCPITRPYKFYVAVRSPQMFSARNASQKVNSRFLSYSASVDSSSPDNCHLPVSNKSNRQ